jgi:hypothetical protein
VRRKRKLKGTRGRLEGVEVFGEREGRLPITLTHAHAPLHFTGPSTAPAADTAPPPAAAAPADGGGVGCKKEAGGALPPPAASSSAAPSPEGSAAAAAAARAKLNPDAPAWVPPSPAALAAAAKKGGAAANGGGAAGRRRSRSSGSGSGAGGAAAAADGVPATTATAAAAAAVPGDADTAAEPGPGSTAGAAAVRTSATSGGAAPPAPAPPPRARASSRRKAAVQRALEAAGAVARTVYICDVDPGVTEATLAALFACCGAVVDCRVCGDPNSAMRFAFVEFRDPASVEPALGRSGSVLGAFPIRVAPSKTAIVPVNRTYLPRDDPERARCGRTVYVANIDRRVGEADVRAFFEGLCGPVTRLRLLGDGKHAARIAFVEFEGAESARAALGCSGALLGGLPVRVSPSKTPVRIGAREAAEAAGGPAGGAAEGEEEEAGPGHGGEGAAAPAVPNGEAPTPAAAAAADPGGGGVASAPTPADSGGGAEPPDTPSG